ncbi:4a-hydroxytetrahydrobiopterin dehydratase [Pseudanabaena sp. FACHB-2040]|uniref:4a-hydroxytetrahydrobiopterin dehydratase n=1 Tax=Pseudanabaena sp. FACHB-2040 TaxID=2692859 RepID=UPI00168341CB|nr:4a-hydroxytetrahydrobiopterin dehydratase [Pseudanabaena sp. FACHB-2040]MBD2260840.1 4a-hydroxytetrahydrobiopterin dehydratase [Pseudanabaena sp. FACHB-2040]
MAKPLSETEVQLKLSQLTDWILEGKIIKTTRTFTDFVEAVSFVNRLVEPAEAAGHHPDIAISYNQVTISLTTHDAGGLTEQDFAMAETLSKLV